MILVSQLAIFAASFVIEITKSSFDINPSINWRNALEKICCIRNAISGNIE